MTVGTWVPSLHYLAPLWFVLSIKQKKTNERVGGTLIVDEPRSHAKVTVKLTTASLHT
jgi:hypothetical protein